MTHSPADGSESSDNTPNGQAQHHGPFDIVGDVHGCFDELHELLDRLGYGVRDTTDPDGAPSHAVTAPPGRRLVLLGDLIDRGPNVVAVLRLAMGMVGAGSALCLLGNHDAKLQKKLHGRDVQLRHGLAETVARIAEQPEGFAERVAAFLGGCRPHLVLDEGRLVVAHAGLREALHGSTSREADTFALFGDTTGQADRYGLPIRRDWAASYRGEAMMVYGHTPVPEPVWRHRTINIDTGCVFGGALTALRYPEAELVSVPAHRVYTVSPRPFLPEDVARRSVAT